MKKIVLAGKYPAGTAEKFREEIAGYDAEIVEINSSEEYNTLSDADVLILRVFKAPAEFIMRNKKLKLICRWGVGVDTIDLACASANGITITNTPGANAYAVSDLAVLLMLAVGRNLMFHHRSIHNGIWSRTMFTDNAISLNNKTVGIIGGGNIGRQVARKVQAFGSYTQYYDVFRLKPEIEKEYNMTFAPLNELLSSSDVVSIHVPLLDTTRHMINAEKITLMKKGAILINTARGGLVDDKALLDAIDCGHLMGAGLDCVEDDPLPDGHPMLNHPNIIITPHIGGVVSDISSTMIPMIGSNLRAFLKGDKLKFTVQL